VLEAMMLPALSQSRFTGTNSKEAYEAFLEGEEYVTAWNAEDLSLAITDFQRAIDLDPGYTLAYIGLAQAIYELLGLSDPPEAERQSRCGHRAEARQRVRGRYFTAWARHQQQRRWF